MKYYVVADVHGFYSKLRAALEEEGYFSDPVPHKLIVCGDLFDRGSEAAEMRDFILGLLARDEVILIRGNHEDLLVELAENAERWFDPLLLYSHHWHNGTVDTLLRLTETELHVAYAMPRLVRNKLYRSPVFTEILPAMRDYFETEHYVFVHGWLPCTAIGDPPRRFLPHPDWRNASEAEWERARWYNGMLAWSMGVREAGKTVVCGHWTASYGHAAFEGKGSEWGEDADFSPFRGDGILALDASTASSGKVNCVVLED